MKLNQRTWGPFTGLQLTTMVCDIAVATLFPVGAWATVKFTNVSITDPGGVNRAKVDATGHLEVGDGAGPLTVDGTVSTKAVLPAKPIVIPVTLIDGFSILYGPQSKSFGISSLTLTNTCDATETMEIETSTSTGGTFTVQAAQVPPFQTLHLNFPTPLVTTPPTGGTASLQASGTGGGCVGIAGVGIQG